MKIFSFELGGMATNCYVLIDEISKEAAVIDPGHCNSRLLDLLCSDEVSDVKYILLTHGHYDHILGVYGLKEKFPEAQIAIHYLDAECLTNDAESLAAKYFQDMQRFVAADILLGDGDLITLGALEIKVMHTPGHTRGSVCYLCGDTIFSGDTLFCKTIGRTDFKGGSMEDMLKSIRRLGDLPGDYKVLPGHNRETTLEVERHANRYMRKMQWF